MISVTVAANGRGKRCVGAHLRAYGSGRLSIAELEKKPQLKAQKNSRNQWCSLFVKIVSALVTIISTWFPFFFRRRCRHTAAHKEALIEQSSSAPINVFKDKILLRIFSHLDGHSLVSCRLVSRKWNRLIENYAQFLHTIQFDQIRILFDEGEVILYPCDEKRMPTRHPIPSLQVLSRRLHHLTTDSLVVRGLIPIESTPVLKALVSMPLAPKQIYFIWCKFGTESLSLLRELLRLNSDTLVDFGLEDCSPTQLLTDDLLLPVIGNLTSLRVWNDGKSGFHGITDATVLKMANAIDRGCRIESIDLASCNLTAEAVCKLVVAWVQQAKVDMSVSISHAPRLRKGDLQKLLAATNIFMSDSVLRVGHVCLTLFC